jgi:amino acid adenylation domain-containing protein
LINTIPTRVRLDNGSTFAQVVSQVHSFYAKSLDFSHTSLTDIKKWANISSSQALFESIFVLQDFAVSTYDDLPLVVEDKSSTDGVMSTDLMVQFGVESAQSAISCTIAYNTVLLGDSDVTEMLSKMDEIIKSIVASSSDTSALPIQKMVELSTTHQSVLAELGNTKGARQSQTFTLCHSAFEKSAAMYSDLVAVEFSGQQITYGELDKRANCFAHALRSLGVNNGVSVVIATGRRLEMVLSMYAVLKAGGTYTPIDPTAPQSRINLIVSQSAASLVIVSDATAGQFESFEGILVSATEMLNTDNLDKERSVKLPDTAVGADTALVLYTSGSTGLPKGVKINHAGMARLFDEPLKMSKVAPGVRMAQFLNIAFDAAQAEVFICHAGGATLVLRTENVFETIKSVDILHITPTGLSQLDPAEFPNLKQIFTGSEPLPESLAQLWASRVRLINLFGPTETSCYVTGCVIQPGENVSIGSPLFNSAIYVLDQQKQLVPPGVVGEIYIAGPCVSNGYVNYNGDDKFVPDSISGDGTMYATGDMVSCKQ